MPVVAHNSPIFEGPGNTSGADLGYKFVLDLPGGVVAADIYVSGALAVSNHSFTSSFGHFFDFAHRSGRLELTTAEARRAYGHDVSSLLGYYCATEWRPDVATHLSGRRLGVGSPLGLARFYSALEFSVRHCN